MDEARQPGLRFAQIFLSEASLVHRGDFLSVSPETKPGRQELEIGLRILAAEQNSAAVALVVRVESKSAPSALYQFIVEITAIVESVPGQENLLPSEYARRQGLAALYPFVREALVNLTARGRFGPVYLGPLNVIAATSSQSSVKEAPQSPTRASAKRVIRRRKKKKI